jgi:hypothetical protein
LCGMAAQECPRRNQLAPITPTFVAHVDGTHSGFASGCNPSLLCPITGPFVRCRTCPERGLSASSTIFGNPSCSSWSPNTQEDCCLKEWVWVPAHNAGNDSWKQCLLPWGAESTNKHLFIF